MLQTLSRLVYLVVFQIGQHLLSALSISWSKLESLPISCI